MKKSLKKDNRNSCIMLMFKENETLTVSENADTVMRIEALKAFSKRADNIREYASLKELHKMESGKVGAPKSYAWWYTRFNDFDKDVANFLSGITNELKLHEFFFKNNPFYIDEEKCTSFMLVRPCVSIEHSETFDKGAKKTPRNQAIDEDWDEFEFKGKLQNYKKFRIRMAEENPVLKEFINSAQLKNIKASMPDMVNENDIKVATDNIIKGVLYYESNYNGQIRKWYEFDSLSDKFGKNRQDMMYYLYTRTTPHGSKYMNVEYDVMGQKHIEDRLFVEQHQVYLMAMSMSSELNAWVANVIFPQLNDKGTAELVPAQSQALALPEDVKAKSDVERAVLTNYIKTDGNVSRTMKNAIMVLFPDIYQADRKRWAMAKAKAFTQNGDSVEIINRVLRGKNLSPKQYKSYSVELVDTLLEFTGLQSELQSRFDIKEKLALLCWDSNIHAYEINGVIKVWTTQDYYEKFKKLYESGKYITNY